jgi:hypothetical protein
MKNPVTLLFAFILIVSFTSCKDKTEKKQKEATSSYAIDFNKSEINWTAYKTSQKLPVKGKFTSLNILKNGSGATISEALNNTEFSIPVSSIFSNNPDRDNKLKTLFFGVMKDTELLRGQIQIQSGTKGEVALFMNGITEKLPFTYKVIDEKIKIKATMNTDAWHAQAALESLNKACFDLHKGPDGVSKTWSDVAIDIDVYFKKK